MRFGMILFAIMTALAPFAFGLFLITLPKTDIENRTMNPKSRLRSDLVQKMPGIRKICKKLAEKASKLNRTAEPFRQESKEAV
jgi:hypothetical protein